MEHAFGRGAAFALGIEEEHLLVDPETHLPVPEAEQVLARIDAPEELVAHEAYAAEIELRSPPSRDAAEAAGALGRLRAAAREAGATLMAVGLHPAARWGDAPLVDAERYRRVEREVRGLIRRTPECALHVHVGMPDGETAIRCFNGLRRHLPLLAGLAASSPFWFGADSGLASARAAIVRAFPGRGVPRAFRDFEDYAETVEASLRAGGLDDATLLWWDVRPHPRLGTIEVRELDVQASLDDAAAIAALIHALARLEAEGAEAAPPPTEAIAWSSFRAARDGIEAEILHDGALMPLREAARAVMALAAPHARELGADAPLEGVERVLREGGAAARHRTLHSSAGMPGLLAALVDETARPMGRAG